MGPESASRGGAKATLALVLGITVTTLCCALPFGVPAIVYALRARTAERAGAPEEARRSARVSIVLSAIGGVSGLLFELFWLVRHLAAGFQ